MCTILPSLIFYINTLLLIISLFHNQNPLIYKIIVILYILCILIMGISMLLCFIANSNNKNILILKEKTFVIFQKEYEYSQVIFARYYVCKWYNIPFIYFYSTKIIQKNTDIFINNN